MRAGNPHSTTRIGKPVYRLMLVPLAIACFLAVLPADLAFWQSDSVRWADLGVWLITVGIVSGVLAAIGSMLEQGRGRVASCGAANALVLVLSFFNMLAHSRPWISIVPVGLLLSMAVVAILPFTCWLSAWRSSPSS